MARGTYAPEPSTRVAGLRKAGNISETVIATTAALVEAGKNEGDAVDELPAHNAALSTDVSVSPPPFDLQLLANFIHQVVNPLNGVAGTLDNFLENKIEGHGRPEQRLRAARAQLEQCISLVRNLAFFAQGFAELRPQERRAVIVPQVIIEAAQVFQEQAENRSLKIDLVNPRDQNKLFGHHELIRQVFMNLFDNMVKYGKHGTDVTIEQRIQIKRNRILITVKSVSMKPIDREDVSKIFDLGYRGKNAKQIIASGTGLGLYICKKIVEDVHSGKMWVEAAQDGKLTFLLAFPKAD